MKKFILIFIILFFTSSCQVMKDMFSVGGGVRPVSVYSPGSYYQPPYLHTYHKPCRR